MNRKELRDRRLPHARKRLKIAKKQFREAKVEAKEERKESRKERNQSKISLWSGNKSKIQFFLSREEFRRIKS